MEQLRKAILKAESGKNSALEPENRTPLEASDAAARSSYYKATPVQPTEYHYTDTQCVTLDPLHLEANRVLHEDSPNEVVQAYKMLRTQVLQKLKLHAWNSLAIVSPTPGNGKTLTAVNLAISLSQEVKQSVLLVDLDLRSPSINTTLGLNMELGVSDYLMRDEPIKNILVNPGVERLVVLGGTESFSHSSEALGSPKMIALVEELKQRYPERIIIFDLPPMLVSDDTIAFAPYVDAMLLVIEEACTSPQDLQLCADMLGDKPLLGSVLNKSGS